MGFFDLSFSNLSAELKQADNRGIHNFCLGTLEAYFRVNEVHAVYDEGVLVISGLAGAARTKVFVFEPRLDQPGRIDTLLNLQRQAVIYSIAPLPLAKKSRFKECAYDLADVFDPASYPNARKRSKRLSQPFTRLSTRGVELRQLSISDRPAVLELHNAWRDWKLSNPKTMQIMFPKARYLRCADVGLANPENYVVFGAWQGERLLGVRVLYLESRHAFDLANFTAVWQTYSNFAEDFNIATMLLLEQKSIGRLNCGATLSADLSAFKSHWPHKYVESFAYGRIR